MNSELLDALSLIEKEKNISKVAIAEAVKGAILAACEKKYKSTENIEVTVDQVTGRLSVIMKKTVVREVENPNMEITKEDAKEYIGKCKLGDIVEIELDPTEFGRINTNVAKSAIMQKIREEERRMIFDEYIERVHHIVTGIVQRKMGRNLVINLGKADATLYEKEQVRGEKLDIHSRIKVYLLEVKDTPKGTKILVSRTHPELVKCLFEEEVTEIRDGIVEIKSIAREAGHRSKIAVVSYDEDVDPVGACVGMSGSRIDAVCSEIGNEKIDIIEWSDNPAMYIVNALNPAKVISVVADADEKTAKVIVPDHQLSLAIGREGQNARLAAKLTGFKIDIKSESQAKESGEFMDYDDEYSDEYADEYDDDGYYDENGNFIEENEE